MRIEIRGRNVEVTDELRGHVTKRFRRVGRQVSERATLDVEIYEERNPSIEDSHVAEATQTPLEELYEKIAWPLDKKYGHSHDAFKISISNPDAWNDIDFPNETVKKELQQYISKKLTPAPTKVRADIEVTCFSYEGIGAVKTALRTAEAENTPENQVKVKLVAPPLYVLTSQCLDKNVGIQQLQASIQRIEVKIKEAGGNCIVKMAPKAVTEHDDAILQELMEKRERENQEVSGDESGSESDEGVPE